MNYKRLKDAKSFLDVLYENFEILENGDWLDLPAGITSEEVLKNDICNFIMYVIASDETITTEEVEIYRFFTGYGGDDMESIKGYIEESDVMSYDFQSKPPYSLIILINATNAILRNNPDADANISKMLELYLLVFMMIGKEMMQADERVSYAEKQDYETYLDTIKAYVKRHSYVNVDGAIAKLMTSLSDFVN